MLSSRFGAITKSRTLKNVLDLVKKVGIFERKIVLVFPQHRGYISKTVLESVHNRGLCGFQNPSMCYLFEYWANH